jgi:erythromycin esterase-like protein
MPNANEALGGFTRFPAWMWRNTVVRDFVEWLRAHNDGLRRGVKAGSTAWISTASKHPSRR